MAEYRFENSYEVTLEEFAYWDEHPVGRSKSQRRVRTIMLYVVAILGALLAGIGWRVHVVLYLVIGVAFIILSLLMLFVLPARLLRRDYARQMEVMGKSKWIRTTRLGDAISVTEGKRKHTFSYDDIVALSEDQRYCSLTCKDGFLIRLRKDGFTKGSYEDCRELIEKAMGKTRDLEK